jgi:general secretion pathway protein J
LRRLIEQIEPGGKGMPDIEGDARTLSFSTELPSAADGAPTQVQALLRVDPSHRLILRWSPTRHVQLLGPPPAPVDTVLLEGVDHIELAYQLPPPRGSGWVTSWKSMIPPRVVRIHIALLRGDVRRWPDILAAPMRDRVS